VTPRNGEPLVAATQDFLTASYLLTLRDRFYTRDAFIRICSYFSDGLQHLDIPPPAVIKPMELWTGKQVISLMVCPTRDCTVRPTFEVACRNYSRQGRYMCEKDGYACFHAGELMCGALDKKVLGSGCKDNLFHVLLREYSADVAADRMSRLARLCARFLTEQVRFCWFSTRITSAYTYTRVRTHAHFFIHTMIYAHVRTLILNHMYAHLSSITCTHTYPQSHVRTLILNHSCIHTHKLTSGISFLSLSLSVSFH
jgi:RNA polymerase Rpb1, domain 3